MTDITLIQAFDWIARVTLAASLLYAIVPPYETFNDFPGFQKYYKLALTILKYFAVNVRTNITNLYPSFKKENGNASKIG